MQPSSLADAFGLAMSMGQYHCQLIAQNDWNADHTPFIDLRDMSGDTADIVVAISTLFEITVTINA